MITNANSEDVFRNKKGAMLVFVATCDGEVGRELLLSPPLENASDEAEAAVATSVVMSMFLNLLVKEVGLILAHGYLSECKDSEDISEFVLVKQKELSEKIMDFINVISAKAPNMTMVHSPSTSPETAADMIKAQFARQAGELN